MPEKFQANSLKNLEVSFEVNFSGNAIDICTFTVNTGMAPTLIGHIVITLASPNNIF